MKDAPLTLVRPAAQRTFALVRVDSIDVVSPRGRGIRQFDSNVRSIADNGLYKPILVNSRDHPRTGRYHLICGEGRLRAHRELKRHLIKAEIVNVDLAIAHIMTLGENMTKCPPQVIEYAYALQEMHKRGTSIPDMEKITGHPAQYVKGYIKLVEQGEERLIKGVEQGTFTLEFAMKVAESQDGAIQHVLMDAFDRKLITSKQVEAVRKILVERTRLGGSIAGGSGGKSSHDAYSIDDLKRDIARITKEKQQFVQEAEGKETRVICLVETLRRLRGDSDFMVVLRRHKLDSEPELQGKYVF